MQKYINWSFLLIGLKNHWLNLSQIIEYITETDLVKEMSSEEITHLISNEEDRNYVINFLNNKVDPSENSTIASRKWMMHYLIKLVNYEVSIQEKLEEIAKVWAMFDYPDELRRYIYYMPNDSTNSPEEVYASFLNYLMALKADFT